MRRLIGVVAVFTAASTVLMANPATAQTPWTPADKAAALRAAHHEANKFATRIDSTGWPTNVRSVTAVIESGPIPNGSNTGHPCGRRKHAVITLIGNFPTIAVGGVPGQKSSEVHGVVATTKLGSSQICLIAVKTGKVTPAPDSEVLFSR